MPVTTDTVSAATALLNIALGRQDERAGLAPGTTLIAATPEQATAAEAAWQARYAEWLYVAGLDDF